MRIAVPPFSHSPPLRGSFGDGGGAVESPLSSRRVDDGTVVILIILPPGTLARKNYEF